MNLCRTLPSLKYVSGAPGGAIHSTKIPTCLTGKSGPPHEVDQFFETFPLGLNRSIEFWTETSGNFGPKLNGSVRSNRESFEKTGPPFEVVLFSRSNRSEFWLNGSRP